MALNIQLQASHRERERSNCDLERAILGINNQEGVNWALRSRLSLLQLLLLLDSQRLTGLVSSKDGTLTQRSVSSEENL